MYIIREKLWIQTKTIYTSRKTGFIGTVTTQLVVFRMRKVAG